MNLVAIMLTTIALLPGEKRYSLIYEGTNYLTRVGKLVDPGNGYKDKVIWEQDSGVAGKSTRSPAEDTTFVYEYFRPGKVMPSLHDSEYYLDLWQHPWAVARYFNVKPFSKEHYAKMRPLWEMLADAGQKSLTVTILDLPWNHQCYDGYYTMLTDDFKLLDEYIEFGKSCGIGPWISFYTMCPWGYKVNGVEMRPQSKEYQAYWRPRLIALRDHLKEKGWLDHSMIAMDERAPEDMKAIADLIKECAPEFKIQTAGNRKASAFKGIEIFNYSQGLDYVDGDFFKEVDERRQKGLITTHYVCCTLPNPNTFMHSSPEEAYALGAYPANTGLSGFLRWAYNSWPQDPDKDASFGNWPAGDTFLVYPDGSPSIRFLFLRNGISDCVKAWLYRK